MKSYIRTAFDEDYNFDLFLSCQILDWLAGLLLHAIQLALMLQEPLGE